MSLHPRRRALRVQIATIVWLAVVWVLLWGGLTPANVIAGMVLAVVVTRAMPMPRIEFQGKVHVGSLLYLVYRFARDIVVASAEVAWLALRPGRPPHGVVIGVQLRSRSDLYMTLTGEMCTLVPGSVVIEAHRITGMLYLHVLDLELAGGLEGAHRTVLETEERVLRALGSDAELAAAGLTRRPRRPRSWGRTGDPARSKEEAR